MKNMDYDFKVTKTIKILRGLKAMKQQQVADALFMERSNYTKIETGKGMFSLSQLKILAELFGISLFQLLAITEAGEMNDIELSRLSDILLKIPAKTQ